MRGAYLGGNANLRISASEIVFVYIYAIQYILVFS